jgi:hypothetical protein
VKAADEDPPYRQTYEGNIRGIRALMGDLEENQPSIFRKLKPEFDDLDRRQSRADTIMYVSYGASGFFFLYGMARWFGAFHSNSGTDDSGFSFTPFLLSMGTWLVGSGVYLAERPSQQEYLDFTNHHNRINKKQQLDWKVGFDFKHAAPVAGVAFYF